MAQKALTMFNLLLENKIKKKKIKLKDKKIIKIIFL